MSLPIAVLVRPSDLAGSRNGQLPDELLVAVEGDRLHHLAARSWAAMKAEAKRDGVTLAVGADAYRPLVDQERIFRDRYTQVPERVSGARYWPGHGWWVKKPGEDAAAVPGTSNHGWGLAVDVANCRSETTAACRWLKAHAHRFGWSAEIQSEPWHWRAVHGDRLPAEVIEHEIPAPAPDPVPLPPTINPEDPMPVVLIACPPAQSAVFARFDDGYLSHIGGAELAFYRSKGVELVTENDPGSAGRYVAEAAANRA